MNMKAIRQSTYETCLPCCLLMMTGGPRKDEIEIWRHGWKFNYLIGQLNFVARKYGKRPVAYVEDRLYFNDLGRQRDKRVGLVNRKVDLGLLDELLESGRVIVYLDCYFLQKVLHAPHFVVAMRRFGDAIEIADPFDGERKKVPIGVMRKAISSLRDHLKYSPVLVVFPGESR